MRGQGAEDTNGSRALAALKQKSWAFVLALRRSMRNESAVVNFLFQ